VEFADLSAIRSRLVWANFRQPKGSSDFDNFVRAVVEVNRLPSHRPRSTGLRNASDIDVQRRSVVEMVANPNMFAGTNGQTTDSQNRAQLFPADQVARATAVTELRT